MCTTTLARLTALPLLGKPFGTTAMLLTRGLHFAETEELSSQANITACETSRASPPGHL